jgi:hypothetical protein
MASTHESQREKPYGRKQDWITEAIARVKDAQEDVTRDIGASQ